MVDGLGRHDEAFGDVDIPQPFGKERSHLELASCEPGRVGPCRGPHPAGNVATTGQPQVTRDGGSSCSGAEPVDLPSEIHTVNDRSAQTR